MEWKWAARANGEFLPPQVATLLQGWNDPKADLKSQIPQESEVFVREVIQNFVDAARQEQVNNPGSSTPSLTFRFIEVTGAEAKTLAKKLDLKSISDRYSSFDEKTLKDQRLSKSDTVLGRHDKIKLLVLTETNTCGMYGQWKRSDQVKDSRGNEIVSRMRDALVTTVRESAGKGLGAFGEGKKAVIGISAARTLLAYTCFDPKTSTDDVSRRFAGGVYWQNHVYNNSKFTGFAMIGGVQPEDDVHPEPLSDSQADDAVRELGIPGLDVREPSSEKGTTYVFVDHITSSEEVAEAIARNWWPLILDNGAEFKVIKEDGSDEEIVFKNYLIPFVDAYQKAESQQVTDWLSVDESQLAVKVQTLKSSSKTFPLGELKLAIDFRPVIGWSRKDPENNMSIVALVRDGMIIAYQSFPKARRLPAPFVRGTFTVKESLHPISANHLRSVEPPLHNKWQENDRASEPEASKAAKDVYAMVNEAVREFRDEHAARVPTEEQNLKIFRENLSISGGKRIVVPPEPAISKTPWSMLSNSAEVRDNKDGRRIAIATRSVELSKKETEEHAVMLEVGWEILEDSTWVDASESLLEDSVSTPGGWTRVDGKRNVFKGDISNAPALFSWKSRPYRELWTLRPFMNVTSLKVAQEEAAK